MKMKLDYKSLKRNEMIDNMIVFIYALMAYGYFFSNEFLNTRWHSRSILGTKTIVDTLPLVRQKVSVYEVPTESQSH